MTSERPSFLENKQRTSTGHFLASQSLGLADATLRLCVANLRCVLGNRTDELSMLTNSPRAEALIGTQPSRIIIVRNFSFQPMTFSYRKKT